jgi:uncharacterized protein RhaS with RHS repeats
VPYYGYRYYSTELGRWISRDPIQEKGGLNLYGFAKNSSTDYSDRIGLITSCSCDDMISEFWLRNPEWEAKILENLDSPNLK